MTIETRSIYTRVRLPTIHMYDPRERDEVTIQVNVGGYTNYRRFLLRHLTKSPSSKVTSRRSFFFPPASTTTNGVCWHILWTDPSKYFKFSLLFTYTSADKIHIQQFQFWLLNSLSQRDYLNTFYISYIFLHVSNFGNFIFRDNAIAESDHFYLVQIPRCGS